MRPQSFPYTAGVREKVHPDKFDFVASAPFFIVGRHSVASGKPGKIQAACCAGVSSIEIRDGG
jgi:hypothetical protein